MSKKTNWEMDREDDLNGLSPRHVAQIVRSKMTTKMKPSKKGKYTRTKNWSDDD
jgi:hypothetical protein